MSRNRSLTLALAAALLAPGLAAAQGSDKPKVLFFTKSSGFQHSAIARQGDELSHAEKILTEVGRKNGFEVVCSKDGRMFDPDKIGQWDVFVFYTTGDLTKEGTDKQPPISEAGLKAFFDRIQSGEAAFIGVHSSTDTFGTHRGSGDNGCDDPYIQMIGGHFNGHAAQQEVTLTVTDPAFPGAKDLPREFKITDEWYAQRCQPEDLHVIIKHNTEGMEGPMYERPDYPQTWAHNYGKGRVFYTSMGHREDVWSNEMYQDLLAGALKWASGKADAAVEPNTSKFTPEFQTLKK
jgi:type 1 glutamine amidotransferase